MGDLEIIVLRDKSEAQKDKYYFLYMRNLYWTKSYINRQREIRDRDKRHRETETDTWGDK